MSSEAEPQVGIVMGSDSDLKIMQHAARALDIFEVAYEAGIKSAHRTPHEMYEYSRKLSKRGIRVVIAGAGGSAHLPGMVASIAHNTTVLGVAIGSTPDGVQAAIGSQIKMPSGEPLSFMGINEAGAFNAGVQAVKILAASNPGLDEKIEDYYRKLAQDVVEKDQALSQDGITATLDAMALRVASKAAAEAQQLG